MAGFDSGTLDQEWTKYSKNGGLKCSKAEKDCFSTETDLFGLFNGAVFGFNHTYHDMLVAGVEADVGLSTLGGLYETDYYYPSKASKGYRDTTSFEGDISGSVRARVGIAPTPDVLIYGTGGLAWILGSSTFRQDKYSKCSDYDCGPGDLKTKPEKLGDREHAAMLGYTIGAGMERRLGGGPVSVKAEYLYTSYFTNALTLKDATFDEQLSSHSVRFGVNVALSEHGPMGSAGTANPVSDPWEGHYVGLLASYGVGDADLSYDKWSKGAVKCTKASHCFSDTVSLDGMFGGATLGYNHSKGNGLVVGFETDVLFGDYSGSSDGDYAYNSGGSKAVRNLTSVEIDLAGSVRGRLGFAHDNFLLYGTGGLAWALHDTSYTQDKYSGCSDFACDEGDLKSPGKKRVDESGALLGLALGGGVEYRVGGGPLSLKAEYLYTGYLSEMIDGKDFRFSNVLDGHSVRVGANLAVY